MNETALDDLPGLIAGAAEPLPDISDPAFGAMFDRFGDARVVLLGEASHGTSEFYRARAAISKRLIERHGFNIIAVEADWPDAATVDRYVRHRPIRAGEIRAFERFPTWMWRNREFDDFVRWMRNHNAALEYEAMTGFYGLDLYNMSGSIDAVIDFLSREDPGLARLALDRYGCLEPWIDNPAAYGRHSLAEGYARCETGVVRMLADLLRTNADCFAQECEEWLDARQNPPINKNP